MLGKSRYGAGPGSQVGLRTRNTDTILTALRDNGPLTQAQLVRITGLSNGTVNNIVHDLEDRGILQLEIGTSSGRRAKIIRFADVGSLAVGIDVGRRHVRVIIANAAYQVIAEESIPLPHGHRADDVIARTLQLLDRLMSAANVSMDRVLGIGVGVPGPINQQAGVISEGTVLPEWEGVHLSSLQQHFAPPVLVANDADLGALAEVTWGAYRGVENLIFVKVGTGIGTGLILDGGPYRGSTGMTGEIAHLAIRGATAECLCGRIGCLEAVASTRRMISQFAAVAPTSRTGIDDFIWAIRDGNVAANDIFNNACGALGEALAQLTNILAPQQIVLGGPLAPLGNLFSERVREAMVDGSTMSPNARAALVSTSSVADRAEALGAASLVLRSMDLVA